MILITQIAFWKTIGEIRLYCGKYQNDLRPVASWIYKDFE